MNKKDKEEFTGLITDALNDVMIPALESMEERLTNDLASKKDLEEVRVDLGSRIDSLDRKFNSQQERLDRHAKVQENLEKRVSNLETKMIAPQTY